MCDCMGDGIFGLFGWSFVYLERVMAKRLIFHVDVNSAFLSWEATRRVKEGGEDIRLIPSVIGGDPSKRTSIVTAKSIPAKEYGIQTGEPVALAMRKCPGLYVAQGDFATYRKYSKLFKDICRSYAPEVEEFSIDECFMDLTGTSLVYPDPIALAYEIKDKIKNELGFTVNIGIGNNKLLAKMASDFTKPDRVHTLFVEEIPTKMWPLPVGDLLFVGKKSVEVLERHQIKTIGDLAKCDMTLLKSLVGEKAAMQMHDYANGIDMSPVSSKVEEAKGFSVSTTLEENVVTYEQAHIILMELADSVAMRIRKANVTAYCVAVTIRDNNFRNQSHQKNLFEPTDITDEIYEVSKELFQTLWDGHTPIRLLKIALSNIDQGENVQFSLFEDENKEKSRKMDQAVDAIREKFGNGMIQRGVTLNTNSRVGKRYLGDSDDKSSDI